MIYSESAMTDFSYPVDETREAIQRRDVVSTIGCIQSHLMRIVMASPGVFDVQKSVTHHILATLRGESINVNSAQERALRELLQTVHRGMRGGMFHGVNLRSGAIQRLSREGSLWLQEILEKKPTVPDRELPILPPAEPDIPDGSVSVETPSSFKPTNIIPAILPGKTKNNGSDLLPRQAENFSTPGETADTGNGTPPKETKYSANNPPKIPNGFHPEWNMKKWRVFCLFYGYSPETTTFDISKSLTREQISEELKVAGFDIAFYLIDTHKDITLWASKEKVKKTKPIKIPKSSQEIRVRPTLSIQEIKPPEVKPISVKKERTPKQTPVGISRKNGTDTFGEGDNDDDEEIYAGDEEIDEGLLVDKDPLDDEDREKDSRARKGIDLSDGVSTLKRQTLDHRILSDDEVNELGNIIQGAVAKCNQVLLTDELLEHITDILSYAPPKIGKKISISSIRRSVSNLATGQTLTGELLILIRKIATAFLGGTPKKLGGTPEQIELAEIILSQISGDITPTAQEAINTLVRHNQKLAFDIAGQFSRRGVDIEDLHQEGNIGLIKAAMRFEPKRENKFSTYATWWIEQAIRRAIANQGRTIRIPIHQYSKNGKLLKVIRFMTNELGRDPTNEEISEELGIPLKKIIEWRQTIQQPISLNAPKLGYESGGISFGDTIADTRTPGSDQRAIESDEQGMVAGFLKTLTPREQKILNERFGLQGQSSHTLEEVSKFYEVTRERIRQLEKKALSKLKQRMPHKNPFEHTNTRESPLESAKIATFLETLSKIDLTPQERRILASGCGLEKDPQTLSTIAKMEGIPEPEAMRIKDRALDKLPPRIKTALELRWSRNNHS